jgi:CHASE3 domain sensor protein
MKTKYPIPVHRDIIIIYILVLLGLVGRAASWAWENTKSNPGIQQTTTSQKVITQTEQVKVPTQKQILTTKVNISVT